MKITDLKSLYDQYGEKSSGELSPNDQHALKEGLDSVKDINNKYEAKKFLQLLALLRESEVKSIDGLGDSAMATITGAFAGGDEGVYAADTDLMNARFIFELVQNVDDCRYKDVNNCTLGIHFDIATDVIRLEYNELGFQPQNVLAITGLGNSTKNHKKARNIKAEKEIDQSDLQEIGEKGIGFKSIFGLAKKVKITSQYFCFTIDRNSFFVPIVDNYKNFNYTNSTILELTLDEGMVEELFSFLKKKYGNVEAIINENPILFLNKLTEIKYYKSESDYFGFRVSRSNQAGEYSEEETTIEYFSSDRRKSRSIEAYRFSHNIEYSVEECRSRYGEQEDSTRKHKIIVIAPKKADMIRQGRIYSFFATSEEINAPFIIHAPFRLNSGRTRIDSQSQGPISKNKWFLRTQRETISMVHHVYERLAEYQGNKIRYYIPSDSLVNAGCALASREIEKNNILTWNIFEDVDGIHRPASEVCTIDFNADLEQLIEIHNILGIRKQLLNIESKEVGLFRTFFIDEIGDIRNKLLKCALIDKEKTADCLKYVKDYEPEWSIRSISNTELKLSYNQLIELSKFDKISAWINQHTFDFITPGKTGAKIDTVCSGDTKSVDIIKSFCDEYGEAINKQFVSYLNRLKYYEAGFKNTIYLYDVVFGKNMLEDFAEAYHMLESRDKFFYPFLRIEAVSEEIDMLCESGDEISDFEFLSSLKVHRTNQKNMLKNQYQSILDLIEKSGTVPERFFPEILQNIDDCIYRSLPRATIRSDKTGDVYKLYVEYNEVGFSREQIRAITAIGDSTKKKLLSANTTGEKGIGFKSIFALCSSVSIESGYFSFRLSAEKPTVPEYIKEIEYHDGTRMVFTLKSRDAKMVMELLSDEQRLVKNCLCLKQLHSLNINQKEIVISKKENRRTVKFGNNEHEYFLYVYPVKVDNFLALHQRQKTKDVLMLQKIDYLVPLDEGEHDYCVYSTFPTQENINIPMIINMPLELDTARERIQDGEWNREIICQMMEGLLAVYDKLKYIAKEKLPMYFPLRGKVLAHKYGQSSNLLIRIASSSLFKLALKNEYTSLKAGVFSRDFEYMLFRKYGTGVGGNLQNKLLAKDEDSFYRLTQLYDKSEIKEREFADICIVIDSLFSNMKRRGRDLILEKEFREELYRFLADSPDRNDKQASLIRKWEIIPIRFQKKTKYEVFSEEIYAPSEGNIDSEKYKILDKQILPIETFNRIYSHITGQYKAIQTFTRDVIITEFFNEVSAILKNNNAENKAREILALYVAEKNLFEETFKSRKDFPVNSMCFLTRTGTVVDKENCYICEDKKSQGCLDKIIVSNEYFNLAKFVGVNAVGDISSYKQISFEIGRQELAELKKNNNLAKKSELFSSLYMFKERAISLRDGIGFFELYAVTPRKVRLNREQDIKIITISEEILQSYSDEINEISTNPVPINFIVDFELYEFEKDNILEEIRDELQIRKETEKLNAIMGMLSNCFYALLLKREPCYIRTKTNSLLLVDSKVIADYDIIEVLKAYFLKYFNTELSINRNIRLYSRRGFENISTIESNDEEVTAAVAMLAGVNLSNLEEVKDFLCRPIVLNGITYGGYAKTCPLCGRRVDTELTGMRIYKTKSDGMIIPLISCSNCYENLRYSSYINVDAEKLSEGILEMECKINGFDWSIKEKIVRLGHRALIKKMNER